jgi:prevent-host-death family protein
MIGSNRNRTAARRQSAISSPARCAPCIRTVQRMIPSSHRRRRSRQTQPHGTQRSQRRATGWISSSAVFNWLTGIMQRGRPRPAAPFSHRDRLYFALFFAMRDPFPMNTTVSIGDAKPQLADLVEKARQGQTHVITVRDQPAAQLGPVRDARRLTAEWRRRVRRENIRLNRPGRKHLTISQLIKGLG